MPGLLTSAMRAEMARPGGIVAAVATFDFASGERSYSDRPIASDTLGSIKGDVVPGGFGRCRRAVSDPNGGISLSGTSVTIIDTSRNFANLLRDENRYSLSGTEVVCRFISPNVDPADWATFFSGVLDTWSRTGSFQWKLDLTPLEKPLLGPFPRLQVLPSDFPNPGDRSVYGLWAPAYWGIHDSRGTTDQGFVPAHYVDRIGFRYLVAFGWLLDVPRVYVDGVLESASNYSITRPTINGRLYTLIDFTSDQGDDAVVTCDVEGYETDGDGGGTLITGADVLKHQAVNFIWNDPPDDGLWLPDADAPVNVAGFAAAQTFLERQGWHQTSEAIDGTAQRTGKQAIQRFLESTQALKAFFTREGELSLGPNDHATTTLSYDYPRHIRFDQHERGAKEGTLSGPTYLRDHQTDRISAGYLFDTAGGAFRRNLEVRDIKRDISGNVLPAAAPSSVDLPLSHASLEA